MPVRSYAAGRFELELGGAHAAWVQTMTGGHAVADVVTAEAGPEDIAHKHISGVKYEDIVLALGADMSSDLFSWLAGAVEGHPAQRSGAIRSLDFNLAEQSRLNFFNAVISEIGFPALDTSSRSPGVIAVTLSPEFTRVTTTLGGGPAPTAGLRQQKKWLPSNFRLKIDGLDASRVTKIEPLTFTLVPTPRGGIVQEPSPGGAGTDLPQLIVTLAAAHPQDFAAWHQAFVVEGRTDQLKNGSLATLYPNLRDVVFGMEFQGLGIQKIADIPAHTGVATPQFQVVMFFERVKLTPGAMMPAVTGTILAGAAPPPSRVDVQRPQIRSLPGSFMPVRPSSV